MAPEAAVNPRVARAGTRSAARLAACRPCRARSARASDFVVEECWVSSRTGAPHQLLWVEKQDANTVFVARALAARVGCARGRRRFRGHEGPARRHAPVVLGAGAARRRRARGFRRRGFPRAVGARRIRASCAVARSPATDSRCASATSRGDAAGACASGSRPSPPVDSRTTSAPSASAATAPTSIACAASPATAGCRARARGAASCCLGRARSLSTRCSPGACAPAAGTGCCAASRQPRRQRVRLRDRRSGRHAGAALPGGRHRPDRAAVRRRRMQPAADAGAAELPALLALAPLPERLGGAGLRAERRALVVRPKGLKSGWTPGLLDLQFRFAARRLCDVFPARSRPGERAGRRAD